VRDAEVRQLRGAVPRDQNVRGLDVAVDDPLRVRGVEAGRKLADDAYGRFEGSSDSFSIVSRLDLETYSITMYISPLSFLAEVVDADDVRMVDACGRLGLPPEPLREIWTWSGVMPLVA
jgi:hypothetical protein